jgi:hypothetical protein
VKKTIMRSNRRNSSRTLRNGTDDTDTGSTRGGAQVCWQMKQMSPFLLRVKRTPLIQHLLSKDWDATLQRLKTNPSESKTWVELELNPVLFNIAATRTTPLAPSNSESEVNSSISEQQHGEVDQQHEEQLPRETWTTMPPAPTSNSSNYQAVTQLDTVDMAQSRKSRVLPLHLAARNGAPLRVIQALVASNPKAVTKSDSFYDRHALHFACLNEPSSEVVSFLLQKSQRSSVCHSDKMSRLPLHYAAFGKADIDVFDALLWSFPEGAEAPEVHGWLPLYVAVKTQCSFAILRRLVETYPVSLAKKTHLNSTVFQLARCFHGEYSSMECQLCVLQAAVEALYDTGRGQLSFIHISDALWTDQQPSTSATLEEGREDVDLWQNQRILIV